MRTAQEYVVPFRPVGQLPGVLPRTVRLAAKTLPSDRSTERRSVLRALTAHRAGDFALLTLAPLPNQHALFYHEVSERKIFILKRTFGQLMCVAPEEQTIAAHKGNARGSGVAAAHYQRPSSSDSAAAAHPPPCGGSNASPRSKARNCPMPICTQRSTPLPTPPLAANPPPI